MLTQCLLLLCPTVNSAAAPSLHADYHTSGADLGTHLILNSGVSSTSTNVRSLCTHLTLHCLVQLLPCISTSAWSHAGQQLSQ